jgi:hypothetical protein
VAKRMVERVESGGDPGTIIRCHRSTRSSACRNSSPIPFPRAD